jgi:hypothetical protein
MKFDASALLPLVAKLGGFLRSGFKGRDILDDETRASCARFLGGVAYNIALAQRKEEAA